MKSVLSLVASVTLIAACGAKTTGKNADVTSVQGRDTVAAAQAKAKAILDQKYGSSYLLGSIVLTKINAISDEFPQNWLVPAGKICMAEGTIRVSDFEEQEQLVIVSNIVLAGLDKNVAAHCGKNAATGGNFTLSSKVRLLQGSFAKVYGVASRDNGINLSEKPMEFHWRGMKLEMIFSDVYGFFSNDKKEVTDLCSGKYDRECDVSLSANGTVIIKDLQ